jgi:hypothetical protein
MPEELARVAYEAALRSLDKQDELLSELRARTAIVVAVSSVAASFLGEPAFVEGSVAFAVLALLAFVVSVAASLYVLLPKGNLVFSLVGARVYEGLFAFEGDTREIYRRLAYDLDRFWEANDPVIRRLIRAFSVAVVGLAAEIGLLLAALAGTLL